MADLVAPVAYGGQNVQSKQLLHGYKDPFAAAEQDARRPTVMLMLFVALGLHRSCIERQVGVPIGTWTTVPSTRGRADHPLRGLIKGLRVRTPEVVALPSCPQPLDLRSTEPGRFTVDRADLLAGQHALVIDDTWTTGGHAQSTALALREAGASQVSIVVLARWLSSEWETTREFLGHHPHRDLDPGLCPVTGARCRDSADDPPRSARRS